ncbi:MAG: riboflavin kinase [Candidatus Moraniibacteriota bacterium]|jgi:riboflavin kinase/FMN adenylyltransferase
MKNIFEGNVIHGQKEGRKLGFPTANVEFFGELDDGVYAGWAIVDGKKYKAGIMYRNGTTILEAYILDFSGDIYGKKIELEVGEKIREIIEFETNEELISQIEKDVAMIRK